MNLQKDQNSFFDLNKPTQHKNKQSTAHNLHLTAALSSLELRNEKKRLQVEEFGTAFTKKSGINSHSQTNSTKLLIKRQDQPPYRVDTAVVEVSEKINNKGKTDNKKLQEKPKNDLY